MQTVLLVEDDPDDIYLINEALTEFLPSVRVHVAKHGDEAIAYLSGMGCYRNRREYPIPSCIIMDLGLPYRSGLELLAWIRANKKLARLPVVVLTGSQRKADFQKATALGISGFYVKPVNFQDLVAFIGHPPAESLAT